MALTVLLFIIFAVSLALAGVAAAIMFWLVGYPIMALIIGVPSIAILLYFFMVTRADLIRHPRV